MASKWMTPVATKDWDERKARHLLNRAGFGVPHGRIELLERMGPRNAVRHLVYYQDQPFSFPDADFIIGADAYRQLNRQNRSLPERKRQEARRALRRHERTVVAALQMWWMERMYKSPRPLEEKMTLFWHGHFATSAQKVQSSGLNYEINGICRAHATGNFKDLTLRVGQSGAMLQYLDNNRNVKTSPNENWARELMELFTLGVGNYTENDIKESARAFTGWKYGLDGFQYNLRQHDTGEKTFLGQTGRFDGWDIIDVIFEQKAASEFIAGKLWRFFASEQDNREVIAELASTLRSNNYELAPVLERLFLSRAFYDDAVIGSQIKSPVQHILQLVDDLELEYPPYETMVQCAALAGQRLFHPPNVKGWDGGRAWINANSLLLRYNFPGRIVSASRKPGAADGFRRLPKIDYAAMAAEGAMMMDMAEMAPEPPQSNTDSEMWHPKVMLAKLDFSNSAQLVDQLAKRCLGAPLTSDQKRLLVNVIDDDGKPIDLDSTRRGRVFDLLHLLFSMSEYQLC